MMMMNHEEELRVAVKEDACAKEMKYGGKWRAQSSRMIYKVFKTLWVDGLNVFVSLMNDMQKGPLEQRQVLKRSA